jgi:hypothetical protein
MYNLPDPVFRSKDHGRPQSDWGDSIASGNLGLCPLNHQNVGQLRRQLLCDGLDAKHLAISDD